MKQIAQNYKSGELRLIDVPAPRWRHCAHGVPAVSTGTEMMKFTEGRLSLLGKARAARPGHGGALGPPTGVARDLPEGDEPPRFYTPLGYSLSGTIVEVGDGAAGFSVGQRVCCGGNQYATHAEYSGCR